MVWKNPLILTSYAPSSHHRCSVRFSGKIWEGEKLKCINTPGYAAVKIQQDFSHMHSASVMSKDAKKFMSRY